MNPIKNMLAAVDPWTSELGFEGSFPGYHIYSHEWIDRLSHFEDAEEELKHWPLRDIFLRYFRKRFSDAGWQGDGKLQLLWLPPFAGGGAPTQGFYILHVKQSDHGISWIASPYPIFGLEGT
jgi:hypothetical protein